MENKHFNSQKMRNSLYTHCVVTAMGGGNPKNATHRDILLQVLSFYGRNNMSLPINEDNENTKEDENVPFLDCSFITCNAEGSYKTLYVHRILSKE